MSLIGCTRPLAVLGILRTQAGRCGSGGGGAQAQLAGGRPLPSPCRPPTYAADLRRHLRHRTRPRGRGRCRSDGPPAGPGPGGSCNRHRSWLLTRPGPVPRARARGSGRVGQSPRSGTTTGRRASPARPGPRRSLGLRTVCWIAGAYRRCRSGPSGRGSRSGAYCRARAAVRGSPRASTLRGSAGGLARPRPWGLPGLLTVCWITGAYRRCRPAPVAVVRAAGRCPGQGCRVRIAGSFVLGGRRARTARPRNTGCHLGHPPALWIAGMYRHRGSGASRRVPYGGAYPGLSRRTWTARDSESAGQPSASACHAALPPRTALHSS